MPSLYFPLFYDPQNPRLRHHTYGCNQSSTWACSESKNLLHARGCLHLRNVEGEKGRKNQGPCGADEEDESHYPLPWVAGPVGRVLVKNAGVFQIAQPLHLVEHVSRGCLDVNGMLRGCGAPCRLAEQLSVSAEVIVRITADWWL